MTVIVAVTGTDRAIIGADSLMAFDGGTAAVCKLFPLPQYRAVFFARGSALAAGSIYNGLNIMPTFDPNVRGFDDLADNLPAAVGPGCAQLIAAGLMKSEPLEAGLVGWSERMGRFAGHYCKFTGSATGIEPRTFEWIAAGVYPNGAADVGEPPTLDEASVVEHVRRGIETVQRHRADGAGGEIWVAHLTSDGVDMHLAGSKRAAALGDIFRAMTIGGASMVRPAAA